MSLNQRYTWNNFLRDHPDLKEKGLKRTSAEGQKLFAGAFKKNIKEYLERRLERLGRDEQRTEKRKGALVLKIKEHYQTKKFPKARRAQSQIGRLDAALAQFSAQKEQTEKLRKKF